MIRGVSLAPGVGNGEPLTLAEPLSFWGGLDATTGLIIDRWHPQAGACIAGRVLLMPAGRGSSSGSASLAEAVRLGVGPAAILLLRRDPIVIVGALAAAELYGAKIPVALVDVADWPTLSASARLNVRADDDGAVIVSNFAITGS